jgi:hypothetical protein
MTILRGYIAGGMSKEVFWGKPLFDQAARDLRSLDIDVVSPVELDEADGLDFSLWPDLPSNFSYEDRLYADLRAIDTCDAIFMLPTWIKSQGAKRELAHARHAGKDVYEYKRGERGFYVTPGIRPVNDVEAKAITTADYGNVVLTTPQTRRPDSLWHVNGIGDVFAPMSEVTENLIRTFESGATRDLDEDKIDPEGAMSPLVVERFCEYMRSCTTMADGSKRPADNWQRGIPREAYMKSMWRHFLTVWSYHRQNSYSDLAFEEALCALKFNVDGMLHELLVGR